jgi:maltose alpha-D-glucosyltransferase/alpha-amylase
VQLAQGQDTDTPKLNLNTWESLAETANMQKLQVSLIPAYMKTCRWFGGKARTVQSMKVVENIAVPFNKEAAAMLIVEVSYNEGLPEMYLLPVAFASGDLEKKLRDSCPKSVIATIAVKGEKGVLYDAVFNEDFQAALFTMMAKKRRLKDRGEAELVFYAAKENRSIAEAEGWKVSSRLLSAEQSNTSITFEKYFLPETVP